MFAVPQIKHRLLLKRITLSAILHGEHLPIPLVTIQTVELVQLQPPFPSLNPVENEVDEDIGQAKHTEFTIYDIVVLQTHIPPAELPSQ